ncbi:MAG TPA: DoxX family protein [Candidatus Acidoferrum sp.]|nr:DoxX family protein [Candidatus Acidoferrum sp.]
MKFLDTLQPLGLAVLRLALALIFVFHGYPKLVRADAGMHAFFVQHGFPAYFVGLAGILECAGAGLLAIGLFTRPAALLLAIEMGIVIWKVKFSHGVMGVGEYQFELALGAACLALATLGAGALSADALVFGGGSKKRRSTKADRD